MTAIEAKKIIQTMYKGTPTALQIEALKMAYDALDKQIDTDDDYKSCSDGGQKVGLAN